jgi:hypothetical protein
MKSSGADEEAAKLEANRAATASMGNYVVNFSAVYADLPNKLPKQMMDDCTVHLTFAGLLHLVNEKGLKITPVGTDFADFTIAKGEPVAAAKKPRKSRK